MTPKLPESPEAPLVSRSLRNGVARWRSSHHGSDEQTFGANNKSGEGISATKGYGHKVWESKECVSPTLLPHAVRRGPNLIRSAT